MPTGYYSIPIYSIGDTTLLLYPTFRNPLGYNPIDSWLYHSTGVAVQNYSLEEFFTYLKSNSFNVDDWGFPLVVYFAYHILGDNIGIDLLLLLNILVITISSFRLYQLAGYFLDKSYALLVTFIWGTLPFLAYTTVVGLKENFFLFFTISSLYYMYRYLQKKEPEKSPVLSDLYFRVILLQICTRFYDVHFIDYRFTTI